MSDLSVGSVGSSMSAPIGDQYTGSLIDAFGDHKPKGNCSAIQGVYDQSIGNMLLNGQLR